MSRKYKFQNSEGLYFVSFAVVNWIDLFVREQYCTILVDSLNYCQKEKGMEIYCWCIMPSHVHLIFRATEGNPDMVLGRYKEFTSKQLVKEIEANAQESRRAWLLWMFERAASKSSKVKSRQVWQHNNQPIELWTAKVIQQKLNYIHQNPVKAGFVNASEHWRYSSAIDYAGGRGLVDIELYT
jgi:putative transposase